MARYKGACSVGSLYNKVAQTGWLKQQEFVPHSLEAGKSDVETNSSWYIGNMATNSFLP